VRLLLAAGAALALALAPSALGGGGAFSSSDPLLDAIWAAAARTAADVVVPGPLSSDAEGRPCPIALPTVIVDGVARDRCPYVGDLAVEGLTLLLTSPPAWPALRDELLWFAQNQHPDGAIPASPEGGGTRVFFDYNAFWIEDVYDYVLYTGDLALARAVWPNLVELVDGWYPAQRGPGGLLVDGLGPYDYAYVPRRGTTVAYYNAGYVRALRFAAQLATWLGHPEEAAAWRSAGPSAATFDGAFWDASVGAFKDATTGPAIHPEDGNAFAILAGLATRAQALSALRYLSSKDQRPWGNTFVDSNLWDTPGWGDETGERVYPFMTYFEVLARFAAGLDASALEVIRREWGWMLAHGPATTMWESIGPHGGPPPDDFAPSFDHGWSSGAVPLLTNAVLGLSPTSPGWGSFVADPHPAATLAWAAGTVPTPKGPIRFAWRRTPAGYSATVVSPVPGIVKLPGRPAVPVAAGTHLVG
jgi:hypothetical protein